MGKNIDGVARGRTWPVPPCFKDETGTCQATGDCSKPGRTCCDAEKHSTLSCQSGSRCGCVADGECVATSQSDCCSGHGEKAVTCTLGLGFKCAPNATLAV